MACGVDACGQIPQLGSRTPVLPRRQEFPYPSGARKPVFPFETTPPASAPTQEPERPQRQPTSEYAPGVPMPEVFEPPRAPDTFDPATPYEESPTLEVPGGPILPTAPSIRRQTRSPVRGARVTNYNFGLAVTETLLNELAADIREEATSVCEQIVGANVTGSQTTRATTRIDCRRNAQTAQFDVVLQSLTNSNTIGRRPNAQVLTEGCHRADLVKPVFFDGQKFTTRRPQGFVRANNLNRDVRTPFSTLPLFGPMATQIARTQTERLRSTAENETANRLAQRVVPQFNQSVDQQLGAANRSLTGQLRTWLESNRLYPEELLTTTTEDELRMRARMGISDAVSIPGRRLSGRLGSALVHESAINEYLNGMGLAGRSFSDTGMQQLIAALRNREPVADLELAEPTLFSVLLADTNPIRVRFADNVTEIILRMSIQPVGGNALPLQEVRVPVTADTTTSMDNVTLNFGTPVVTPADGSEPSVIQTVLSQQVSERLQPIEIAKQHVVPVSERKSVPVKVGQIEAVNGWLLLSID